MGSLGLELGGLLHLLLGEGDRRVVVEALGHQLQGQGVALAAGLLDLGSLVLEPDLDLRLVQAQLFGKRLTALLRQVLVRRELGGELRQLLRAEGRSGPLLLGRGRQEPLALWLRAPRSRTCNQSGHFLTRAVTNCLY